MRNIRLPTVAFVYNRYGYASATRDHVVELRVSYARKQKYLSTGIRVFPKNWDNRHRCIISRPDAVILNRTLEKILLDVRQVIYDMVEEGNIDIDAIFPRLYVRCKKHGTFLDFCRERAKIKKYGLKPVRQAAYDRFLSFLEEYGKFTTFSDISEKNILALDKYLQEKKMMASSKWVNYHRFLRSFINDAMKENLLTYNPYDRLKINKGDFSKSIEKHLTSDELRQLSEAEMPNEQLEKVRDTFIFQCFTCLSFADLADFSSEKIKVTDGKEVIVGHRGKTDVEYVIPLLQPAREILQKYGGNLPIRLTTAKKIKKGELSNQTYNKNLRKVAKVAGIDKPVSTHWSRHTGATKLLNAGVPIDVVAKVGGWADTKVLRTIYAKLHPETVVNAVFQLKEKIEK